MNDKLQQLLEEYKSNYDKFSFGRYLDLDHTENALKIGLIGCFYLDKSYKPEKRQAINQVLSLYDKYWGKYLNYGFGDGDPNTLYQYQNISLAQKIILNNGFCLDTLSFYWSNVDKLYLIPDYLIKVLSRSESLEKRFNTVSYLQIYLPIYELKYFGVDKLVEFIRQVSQILKPLHGFFGLGIRQRYKYYDFQYLEGELARKYLGLDISTDEEDKNFRDGFKSINWLTILSEELFIEKLGSLDEVKQQNSDEGIIFHSYTGGVMVQAGEVPEFCDISRNPYPKHYVKANALLKPARAPMIASFGFTSNNGKIQDSQTSKGWQSRFDDVTPTDVPPKDTDDEENTGS